MKIFDDLKALTYNPNEFIKDNPKKTFLLSTALKILAYSLLIIETFYPHFFAIASLVAFSFSLIIDYKISLNAEDLIFSLFRKSVNANPYKSSYYIGRMIAIVIKSNPLERVRGFFSGFSKGLFK